MAGYLQTTTKAPHTTKYTLFPNLGKKVGYCKFKYQTKIGYIHLIDDVLSLEESRVACKLKRSIVAPLYDRRVVKEIAGKLDDCVDRHAGTFRYRSVQPWHIGLELYNGRGWWSDGKLFYPEFHEKYFFDNYGIDVKKRCQSVFILPSSGNLVDKPYYADNCGIRSPVLCLESDLWDMTSTDVPGTVQLLGYHDRENILHLQIVVLLLLFAWIVFFLLRNNILKNLIWQYKKKSKQMNKRKRKEKKNAKQSKEIEV